MIHRSTGYSNHVHDDPAMGRVEVMYVGGPTRDALFAEARTVDGPDGSRLPVLRPEHHAAMKAFAMKNDPSRTLSELEDIRFLLSLEGGNRDEVRGHFEQYDLGRLYDEITWREPDPRFRTRPSRHLD